MSQQQAGPAGRRPAVTRAHLPAYGAEFAGTALLVFLGLSAVIFNFGPASPVAHLLPGAFDRRLLTGLEFGGVGALIALSPLGRVSGAHLDPVLSFAFWLCGSLSLQDAVIFSACQLAGAVAGALFLPLAWGPFGQAVSFGMSLPSASLGAPVALLGEIAATFCFIGAILFFVGSDRLRRFTPAMIPPMVSVLVALEAPLSGTSMNPARSLGPAIVAHALGPMWIYLLGPATGAFLAAVLVAHEERVHVAKIAQHALDPLERFHGRAAMGPVLLLRRLARSLLGPGQERRGHRP